MHLRIFTRLTRIIKIELRHSKRRTNTKSELLKSYLIFYLTYPNLGIVNILNSLSKYLLYPSSYTLNPFILHLPFSFLIL